MSDSPQPSPPVDSGPSGVPASEASEPVGEGTVLSDRYRLVRPLGEGGMGAVWEAEHTSLGQPVAVKLIRPELARSERSRRRFLREAQAAAGLRSPYVVQIFDYGVHGDTPFIAMEKLDGETLAERLKRRGRLTPAEVAALMGQLARAIGKAHAASIVHRDLKPDNVFLVHDEDGERCKVLDFGVAKVLTGSSLPPMQTDSGALVGTPFYMSPEQATDSREVGPAADLWSMTIIAYECLVGQRPFDAPSLPAFSVKLLAEPLPVPSEHADVPPGFDAWFARAAAREPEARFGSARELVATLADALGVDTPSISMTMPPAPAPRRRPWGTLAVVVAVGGAAAGWGLMRGGAGTAGDAANEPGTSPPVTAAAEASTAAAVASPDAATQAAGSSDVSPDVPSPVPAEVVLQLDGPQGARIYRGDTIVATMPEPVRLPYGEHPVTLRAVAEGFVEHEFQVVPDRDRSMVLPLTKTPRKGRGRDEPASPKANVDDLEF